MKRVAALLVGLVLTWPLTALAGPKMNISTLRLDLGLVMEGIKAEGHYEVTNTGDEELEIISVQPG